MKTQEARDKKAGKLKENRHKILIVDDSRMNRLTLQQILEDEYDVIQASAGAEGLELVYKHMGGFSCMLLNIEMPVMDGFEVLKVLNELHWIENLPVIVISGEASNETIRRAYELGATDYIRRPFDSAIAKRRVMNTINLYDRQKKLAMIAADEIYKQEKNSRLVVNILSHVLEQRNGESGLHVLNIQRITDILAKNLVGKTDRYPMSREDIEVLCNASALHDIGKIGIPKKILNKPGKLTPEEYELMKRHCILGADMVASAPFGQDEPLVRVSREVCRWHHERWDGGGYPDGLHGDEIPISAQIVSLADVYDALTSDRVYKKSIPHEKAVQMIIGGECGSFNPVLLECFMSVQDRIR